MISLLLPHGACPTTALGLGCSYVTGGFEERRSRRILDAAYDVGLRHFDVAPVYGMGTAENVLGHALKGRRGHVTITSKAGIARPVIRPSVALARAVARPVRRLLPGLTRNLGNRIVGSGVSRGQFGVAFVEHSLSETLRRLQTDYLDLFLLHEATLSDLSDELLGFLDKRRSAGTVRAIGIASAYPNAAAIVGTHRGFFDVIQYAWSVLDGNRICPADMKFAITHQSILRAYNPLRDWLSKDLAARGRLSEKAGEDLSSDANLADLLLAAALSKNPGGIVLAASRQVHRVRRFGDTLRNVHLLDAGRRLADALAIEPERPEPQGAL